MNSNAANKKGDFFSKINGHTALFLFAAIFCIVFFISFIVLLVGPKVTDYVSFDKDITTRVYTASDGSIEDFPTNKFKAPYIGDIVIVNVPLDRNDQMRNAYLCINNYNSVIRVTFDTDTDTAPVFYDMKKLDESEYAKYYLYEDYFDFDMRLQSEGRITGHQLVKIPIPEKAWGHKARIYLEQLDNRTTSRIDNVCAVSGGEEYLYPLIISGPLEFPIFVSFFILGIVFFAGLLMFQAAGLDMRPGIWISLFCFLISAWVMGYNCEIYLLSDNFEVTSLGEYFVLYLVPIAMYGYLKYENLSRKTIIFFKITQWAFTALFVVAFIIEFFADGKGFVTLLPVLHIFLAVTSIILIITIFFGYGPRKELSRNVLKIGISMAIILLFIEVLRLFLDKRADEMPDFVNMLTKHSYSSFVFLIVECTLIISYILRLLKTAKIRAEKQQLQQLAFYDSLTGIPNRTSIEQHLKKLTLDKLEIYTMIFFDTNDLKLANDKYGHETGDKLLQLVGRAISEAFSDYDGFFGRYGGDEFVACIEVSDEADKGIKTFKNILDQANRKKLSSI